MAQLYVHDLVASVTRPVRALAGFRRVTLAPGASQQVEFVLTDKELGFYDRDLRFVVEAGRFEVFVGGSSTASLTKTFEVVAKTR